MKMALLLLVLAVVGSSCDLPCQESTLTLLNRAAELNDKGEFRSALTLIDSVLDSKLLNGDEAEAGVAWNIRGLALQNLGDNDKARRSYEMSIGILRAMPAQVHQYASALANLGSLEADNGQLSESQTLRAKAKDLYESLEDHAGMARASTNLALVALGQGKRKQAHRLLSDAFREEALVSVPDSRDLAWMYSAESLLHEKDGDLKAALTSINRAVELWTERYGTRYYLLALGYSLRGGIQLAQRDYVLAANDLQHSMTILEDNSQGGSETYFLTKIAYANALRSSGEKAEALRIDSEARTALESLHRKRCSGCTISADALK